MPDLITRGRSIRSIESVLFPYVEMSPRPPPAEDMLEFVPIFSEGSFSPEGVEAVPSEESPALPPQFSQDELKALFADELSALEQEVSAAAREQAYEQAYQDAHAQAYQPAY